MNISNAKNKKANHNKNYINKIIDMNYNKDNKNTVENNKHGINNDIDDKWDSN